MSSQQQQQQQQQQGRGSAMATNALTIFFMIICLLIHSQLPTAHAAIYTVGGPGGWTFNTNNWPTGKSFKAGDVLVFNYDSTIHNVVAVDRGGYGSCTAPVRANVYTTGKDRIRLAKGQNFFICSFPGHCASGMKIAVNAA